MEILNEQKKGEVNPSAHREGEKTGGACIFFSGGIRALSLKIRLCEK